MQEIYLLLAVIHVNGFGMTTDMAQRILDRWRKSLISSVVCSISLTLLAAVMGPRPESVEAILNDYNTILQQVTIL